MITNILTKFIQFIEFENTQGVRFESRAMIVDFLRRILKKIGDKDIGDQSLVQNMSQYILQWYTEADWPHRGDYAGIFSELLKLANNPIAPQITDQLRDFSRNAPYEAFEKVGIVNTRSLAKQFVQEFADSTNREPRLADFVKNKK